MTKFNITHWIDVVKAMRKRAETEPIAIDLVQRKLFKKDDFKLSSSEGRFPIYRSGGSTVTAD